MNTAARKFAEDQATWLEDILAGLLINGVTKPEVDVQYHPDRIVVVVRGVPRYERTTLIRRAP